MDRKYTPVSIALPNHQWRWLQAATDRHKLSDISKALRICITCVAVGDVCPENTEYTTELPLESNTVKLTKEQIVWVEKSKCSSRMEKLTSLISHTVQQIVQACSSADEYVVFGTIRCTRSLSSCEGAMEAVKTISKNYSIDKADVMEEAKENISI